ncbi:(Fe-S)-binding protein [Exiguobacterium aurantiacum]|uniref:Glycolate oxidase iron-sulfur subunit n=1 Tax=Exiguobacterium aurantiacum TaxID=33987 RepID=A0A377FS09_9BACL|nr:(Fe-S)-binding protein [Exiguobacterium aurantiacum]STO07133.1 Lactate utilization protein A [Exiguobacterium aurantiacum]
MKHTPELASRMAGTLDYEEMLGCMRCGFCLPTCPTYIRSKDESASPRGRIAIMKGVVDGLIEPDDGVEKTLNECLGCLACEPACPAGVRYSVLLEDARAAITVHKRATGQMDVRERVIRKVVFDGLFLNKSKMQTATSFLRFYQQSGAQTLTRKLRILDWFPDQLQKMEAILPAVPARTERVRRPDRVRATGTTTARVAFFSGCLMDTMFYETNANTIKLLQAAGCDIVIPESQQCCGALHGHAGEQPGAVVLAKRNIEAFESLDVDFVITNAGGCGAFLLGYDHLLHDDPAWKDRAERFTAKIKDFAQVLIEVGFLDRVTLTLPDQLITYQDSCHLRNVQKGALAPRVLLQAIRGTTFVEQQHADHCCGSAGVYNLLQPRIANDILEMKMGHVRDTSAQTIVTSNPGCHLQMQLGIQEHGTPSMRAVHLADLLAEAMDPR